MVFLSVKESANLIGVSERHFRRLLNHRAIKYCRAGKLIRIHIADLYSFMLYRKPYHKLTENERTEIKDRRELLQADS